MKIVFITSGVLPVPAEKGGAVESLADALAAQNEFSQLTEKIDLIFLTIYDQSSENKVKNQKYNKSGYVFIKIPKLILGLDKKIYRGLNNILKLRFAKKFRFTFQRLYFIHKCHRYLQNNTLYDWVIADNSTSLLSAVKKTVYEPSRRTIYYAHNDIGKKIINKSVLFHCSKIITVSDYVQQNIKSVLKKMNSNSTVSIPKFVTIKNGIDTNIFKPYDIEVKKQNRKQYGYMEKDFIFIFVGRLVPEKGIESVILAFNRIALKNRNARLLVIGANSFGLNVHTEFEEKIIKIAKDNWNKIQFTGFVANRELPLFYNLADVAVLPSLWEEPAGLTMVEALSCGIPLITTDTGGISEYVSKESAVLISNPKSDLEQKLEQEMYDLMADKEKRTALSKKAVDSSRLFSHSRYFKDFINTVNDS